MTSKPYPIGSEKKFNKFLVAEYLKAGSVDEVLKKFNYDLPTSSASYHRILDDWGIVKAAGPNNKLAETLDFLTKLAYENIPFDKVYRKMPLRFRTSAATLYRILSYIKEGVTRRLATGLVITLKEDSGKVLVASDISTPRVDLGKNFGSTTIPMGFSKRGDPREDAILRVLQQEVFTKLAVNRKMPKKIIPKYPKPFMYLDIADVRVEVFHLSVSKKLMQKINFSSYKLKGHKFIDMESLARKRNLRVGVKEAVSGYLKYKSLLKRNLSFNPLQETALINSKLVFVDD